MSAYTAGENTWRFRSREHGFERIEPLRLRWEVRGDPISDDYTLEEISARDLFGLWLRRYGSDAQTPIYWSVVDVWEPAPFQLPPHDGADFLTYWTEPVNSVTTEPLNWARLPVVDKSWNSARCDKGGFMQEATSWKPSALQPTVNTRLLIEAANVA